MASPKTLNTYGVLAKVESTYGTDATPAASSDGLLVKERPTVELDYVHDGERGRSPASRSPMPRGAQSGLMASVSAVADAVGAGSAYSSTNLPNLDPVLRAAGLSSTVDPTSGAEKVTYSPEGGTSSVDSASIYVYEREQEYKILGAHGENLTISADGPEVPTWEIPVKGIGNTPSDASLPSITSYPDATLLPPKAENMNLSFNGVTDLVLRSFQFDMGQELHDRADDNGDGFAGVTPGQIDPTLELVFESELLSSVDPYSLRDASTLFSVSFEVGSTQYNRWKFSASKAQVQDCTDDEDGANAIWTVQLGLRPSGYDKTDNFTITFD